MRIGVRGSEIVIGIGADRSVVAPGRGFAWPLGCVVFGTIIGWTFESIFR